MDYKAVVNRAVEVVPDAGQLVKMTPDDLDALFSLRHHKRSASSSANAKTNTTPLSLTDAALDTVSEGFECIRHQTRDYGFMDAADMAGFLKVVRTNLITAADGKSAGDRGTADEDGQGDLLPNEERCLYER